MWYLSIHGERQSKHIYFVHFKHLFSWKCALRKFPIGMNYKEPIHLLVREYILDNLTSALLLECMGYFFCQCVSSMFVQISWSRHNQQVVMGWVRPRHWFMFSNHEVGSVAMQAHKNPQVHMLRSPIHNSPGLTVLSTSSNERSWAWPSSAQTLFANLNSGSRTTRDFLAMLQHQLCAVLQPMVGFPNSFVPDSCVTS